MLRRLMLAATSAVDPIAFSIYTKVTSWWEMNETTGARNDSKGGHHAAVVGTVGTGTGVRGGGDVAAAFAGSGALLAPDHADLDSAADHCFFGWAYTDAATGNQALGSKWNGTTAGGMDYQIDVQNSGVARAINGGSAYYIASLPRPSAAAWHFYMMWRDSAAGPDSGKVRLQIDNGAIALSSAASSFFGPSQLGFGQTGALASQRLTGRLQRWGYIKGAILTPEERTWLFNGGSGRTWAEIVALAGT